MGLLTPPEMARKASQISSAISIPVIADADTGRLICNSGSLGCRTYTMEHGEECLVLLYVSSS